MNDQTPQAVDSTDLAQRWAALPAIDVRQVLRLTDDTGIFQHAVYALRDLHHGYCIDDNSRALLAAVYETDVLSAQATQLPLEQYLTFVHYAFNAEVGRFRNFMSFDRRWIEEIGSQDSQGRAIWALGAAVALAPNEHVRALAKHLMDQATPKIAELTSIRSLAFALLGLQHRLNHDAAHNATAKLRDQFALALLDQYQQHATPDWPWWESVVAYANAKLPHALFVAGAAMQRNDMVDVGLSALRWLLEIQTAPDGYFSIVGNDGWFTPESPNGKPARYDQQPLEAHAMVHACLAAATLTHDPSWEAHAFRCFDWFTGVNDLGLSLYDETTGGCRDGLESDGLNENQGAESTLAYVLSVLDLHRHAGERTRHG